MARSDFIDITTRVSASDWQPMVEFRWGREAGELTVTAARQHALKVLEAAEAAESDAFIAAFARKYGQTDEAVVTMLRAFRHERDVRREIEESM